VKFTLVPSGKSYVHVVPQVIPEGVVVTVPCPTFVTDTLKVVGVVGGVLGVKVAPTLVTWFTVTIQAETPVHAPVQPEKVKPDCGVAVRVTVVLLVKSAAHAEGHEIPKGVEMIEPLPVTEVVRVYD
jgi:hypothetical protein